MQRSVLFLGVAIAALGCAPDASSTSSVDPTEPTFATGCGPGTMPSLGSSECVAVGIKEAPEGFVLDGWKMDAVRPTDHCDARSIARLGSTACEPIDDCNAAFPPPDARVTVRPGEVASADGRTVGSLAEALAIAKAGDTIALDAGTYPPTTITTPVKLVGRCAEKVVFAQAGADQGIEVRNTLVPAELHSLTISGFVHAGLVVNYGGVARVDRVVIRNQRGGIFVANRGHLELSRSVIEGPLTARDEVVSSGITATFRGTAVLSEVEFRDLSAPFVVADPDSSLRVTRSIVAFEMTPSESTATFSAFTGATLDIDESYIEVRRGRIGGIGRLVVDGETPASSRNAPPAKVRITRSALVQQGYDRDNGSGIDMFDGASLELEGVSIRHSCFTAIGMSNGSVVRTKNSAIVANVARRARSAVVAEASRAEIESSAFVNARDVALAAIKGGVLELRGSTVTGTNPAPEGPSASILASADGVVALTDSAITNQVSGAAVTLFETGSTARISRSIVDGVGPDGTLVLPLGVVSFGGAVDMEDSLVRGASQAALAFDGGRGLVRATVVSDSGAAVFRGDVQIVKGDMPYESIPNGTVALANMTFARNITEQTTERVDMDPPRKIALR